MAYNPLNPNGQATMANSQPVVISSNQSPVSVAGSLNIVGNPSVSGTVQVGNFPTTQNVSGSVIAFQGTNPFIITGSVQGSFTAAANQSVSGTVGASVIGLTPVSVSNFPTNQNVSGSVVAFQGTNPFIITGSVQGSFTAAANQSVSGTVGASILGNVNTTITSLATVGGFLNVNLVGGSILTSSTANQSVSGTVGASIIGLTPIQVPGSVAVAIVSGSIAATFTPPANQSVSGTVQTDVRGSVAVVIISGSIAASFTPPANQSVSGAVSVSNFPTTQNVSGSVVAFQGTNPWIITGSVQASLTPAANQSVSGSVGISGNVTVVSSIAGGIFPISGSVAAVITNTPTVAVGGSVVAFQGGTQVTSLVSTVPSSVLVGASIFGQLPAGTAMLGSITAYQGSVPWIITGSVQATAAANQSVSGTVQTDVRGSVAVVIISGSIAASFTPPANQSVSGTVNIGTGGPVSVLGTMSVIGTVPVTQSTTPWIIGSVYGNMGGSVVSFQGTSPWVIQSIVGTYAEDAAHTSSDKGLFALAVRNDTLSSITSNDSDYSPFATGPVGEVITANAPITKWISGQTSIMYGASVVALSAPGASIFTYVTAVQIVNNSANASLVKFTGGLGSVLAWTLAPANGGSNIYYANPLRTGENSGFSASISGVSSVYVSAQGFTAKI